MSQENVQIVHLAFDAIRRRDIEALLQLYDAEIEFLPLTGTLVESGGYAGHAGVRDYFEEVAQVWEEMRPYAHTTQAVDDHVVVTGGCAVRGIGSGVESDDRMASSRCGTERSSVTVASAPPRKPSKPSGCPRVRALPRRGPLRPR